MLFELGGKRKRLIQVIYSVLAGLMFIALVGFGIGGATSGGIFDALGIGGGSSGSDPQYSQQIDNANEALQQDPKDDKALLKLARYNFLEGQAALRPTTRAVSPSARTASTATAPRPTPGSGI